MFLFKFSFVVSIFAILACRTPDHEAHLTQTEAPPPQVVAEVSVPQQLPPVTTEYDPQVSPDPSDGYQGPPEAEAAPVPAASGECFYKMPADKDQGPFYKLSKEVGQWRGRKRTAVIYEPVAPPASGLNLCRTLKEGCVVCESWNELHPDLQDNAASCDTAAVICADQTGMACQCIRSL